MWRCTVCEKWSHAKRRPSRHRRFIAHDYIPWEDQAALDEGGEYNGQRIVEVREGMELDTGATVLAGIDVACGPFEEWRAEQVEAAA
jgi:hypothetical protein